MSVKYFTPLEINKYQISLMLLTDNIEKFNQGQILYNTNPTRKWMTIEDCTITTEKLERIKAFAVVDSMEERDTMTADDPNAFIQDLMLKIKYGEERVTMKITGVLVETLVEISPVQYRPHEVYDCGRGVVYVQVLRAIYGML